MRRHFLLVSLLVLIACGKTPNPPGGEAPAVPPSIISTVPADSGKDVPVGQPVSVMFDRVMDPATITESTFFVAQDSAKIPGAVSYAGMAATFVPKSPLSPATKYKATVTSGCAAADGTDMAKEHSWTFTTAAEAAAPDAGAPESAEEEKPEKAAPPEKSAAKEKEKEQETPEAKPAAVAAAPSAYGKSPGADWHEARKDKDMMIYYRDDAKVNGREVRGFAEMARSPAKIFAVVTDFDNYTKFMPYTKVEKVLSHPTATSVLAYSVVSAPFIANRDCVVEIKMTRGTAENNGVFRSDWTSKPDGAPLVKGFVRIAINSGYWLLEPTDAGNRTRVTYELLTNPGGAIPQWIVNASTTKTFPDLLNAVSKRASAKGT